MPRRIPFQENKYYHIYNRWLNKQTLFHDLKDFERFMWYMSEQYEYYKDTIWIISYCILPNHFHFVLKNNKTWFDISNFIWKISSSYSKYLWSKYDTRRWQQIFESRFKSKHLSNEQYLSQCIKYVEFNPIKHELVKNIDDRVFTSYDKNKHQGKPDREILELDWEF